MEYSEAMGEPAIPIVYCTKCKNIAISFPVYGFENSISVLCNGCTKPSDNGIKLLAYENLVKDIYFPCVYQPFGCNEHFKPKDNITHALYDCAFKQFKCEFCIWSGTLKKLAIHYKHKYISDSNNLLVTKGNKYLLKVASDLFLFETFILKENNFSYSLKYVGDEEKMFKFFIEIIVETKITLSGFVDTFYNYKLRTVENFQYKKFICKIDILRMYSKTDIDKELIKGLECITCLDILVPPIIQCKVGHSICEACKNTEKCPICQATFLKSRNSTMERLIKEFKVERKCRHVGCRAFIEVSKLREHESKCRWKPYQCVLSCSEKIPLNSFSQHLKTKHPKIMYASNKLYINYDLLAVDYKICIIQAVNNLFKIVLKSCNEYLIVDAQLIGHEEFASKYHCLFKIATYNNNKIFKSFQTKVKCTSLSEYYENCIKLPLRNFKSSTKLKYINTYCEFNIFES